VVVGGLQGGEQEQQQEGAAAGAAGGTAAGAGGRSSTRHRSHKKMDKAMSLPGLTHLNAVDNRPPSRIKRTMKIKVLLFTFGLFYAGFRKSDEIVDTLYHLSLVSHCLLITSCFVCALKAAS
jgi:hypothetical protein